MGPWVRLLQCIHIGGKKAIYSPSVHAPPGSFLPHPQIAAQHNEDDHISPSYSPHQTACQKISRVIYEINGPLLSPGVLVRGVPAHAKRLLPIEVTGICKSWAVCALQRFLNRALDNFSQLFWGILATGFFSSYLGRALKYITWKKCFFLIQHTTVASTATVPIIETQH